MTAPAVVIGAGPYGLSVAAHLRESSVPGLFFTSLMAAETFGPVMRFVCGAGFTARRVTEAVAPRFKETDGEIRA